MSTRAMLERYRKAIRPILHEIDAQRTECGLAPEGKAFTDSYEEPRIRAECYYRTTARSRRHDLRKAETKTRFWEFLMRVRPSIFESKTT